VRQPGCRFGLQRFVYRKAGAHRLRSGQAGLAHSKQTLSLQEVGILQTSSPDVLRIKETPVNIIVCIKQVPAKDAPLAIAGNWIKEADISFEMNEPDSYALEEALRLKEKHGGEVIALSLGPERVKQTIKEALAKGADRGIHIADENFAQLDPLGTAKVLAAAIGKEKCDLVLTGLQSEDHGFGQTGVLLAGLLNLPHATIIMQIEVQDGTMKLKRELEAGWFQRVECPLPAVLSIQSGINKVRYATLKGIMAAKKKEIATVTRESLGVTVEPTQKIERIYVPTKTKKTEFLTGTPKEVAAKLVEKLKFEARVI
jgi:electron transfer flavoprotein beta subunit